MRYTILVGLLCVLFAISESLPNRSCGVTCQMFCEYGYEVDEQGCSLCQCKKPPAEPKNICIGGLKPKDNVPCDSTSVQPCPVGFQCMTALADSYAVCCPVTPF